jgi:hypothetical protein
MLNNRFLYGKIRIGFIPEELPAFSSNQVRFYRRYSSFVFKSLAKTSFQRFLNWMLTREHIEKETIRVIQVKILPLRGKNGKGVAGKCNLAQGLIRIYPKTSKFCQLFRRKFGKKILHIYAKNRARAALIHELLHLKYGEDEKTVRELSQEYFGIFTKRLYTVKFPAFCIHTMVFSSRIGKKQVPLATRTNSLQRRAHSNTFKSKLLI